LAAKSNWKAVPEVSLAAALGLLTNNLFPNPKNWTLLPARKEQPALTRMLCLPQSGSGFITCQDISMHLLHSLAFSCIDCRFQPSIDAQASFPESSNPGQNLSRLKRQTDKTKKVATTCALGNTASKTRLNESHSNRGLQSRQPHRWRREAAQHLQATAFHPGILVSILVPYDSSSGVFFTVYNNLQ
jgi:hypothetical protein